MRYVTSIVFFELTTVRKPDCKQANITPLRMNFSHFPCPRSF